jgi:hypothetical protein
VTRPLALTAAVAAVIAVAPVAGSAGRYVDTEGDSGRASDLKRVVVAREAGGQVKFTLELNALPTQGEAGILLMLDTDLNGTTGEPPTGGTDFAVAIDPVRRTFSFGRWAASGWDWGLRSATVSVSGNALALIVSVNQSDLGGTTGVNFRVRTWLDADVDDAPDRGLWNYGVAADGPDIRRVLVKTSPGLRPKAGKRFTVRPIGLELPPSAEPPEVAPQPDSSSCRAKLAGRTLKGSGAGGCSWAIPKTARKQKLTMVLTVGYLGAKKSFTFTYPVA